MTPRLIASTALLISAFVFSACTPANSRTRPLDTSAVNTGTGSLAEARKQLQGSWALERFTLMEAGKGVDVKASATLTYDEYSNLTVRGELLEPLPGARGSAAKAMLDYSGRIEIDPAGKRFVVRDVRSSAQLDPALMATIGPEVIRSYEIKEPLLTISYLNKDGSNAAVATFRRSN
jgi:hypothetical protein